MKTPNTLNRRQAIQTLALASSALSLLNAKPAAGAAPATPPPAPAPTGPFTLPPLPYPVDALEPHIDARTMEIHHDRHHAAYVTNVNKALVGHEAAAKKSIEQLVRSLDELPESIRTTVRNNGGGHLNHSLFWRMMKKGGGGQPKGDLARALEKKFGSFEKFKEGFSDVAMKTFGSGWAWLTLDDTDLKVVSTPNQDSPLMRGSFPLLGIDVWEHAYYLKYQNKRADYVAAFFNVIDWDFVTERFERRRA